MTEISLAPMLKITTPGFRSLVHSFSPNTVVFTEMIVSSTVVNVTSEKLDIMLGTPNDKTVVQIGGSNPIEITEAVKILIDKGWKHFNLNCGCPSSRVQKGCFGAVLMLNHELVSNIINQVYNVTGTIMSIKIRTGVDDNDSYEFFDNFVHFISTNTKCYKFYIHARKCWLNGVSPKHNRNIPPLNYKFVYNIKKKYPNLFIVLNGGIKDEDESKIKNLDGLMIGRHAWKQPSVFADYEKVEYNTKDVLRTYFDMMILEGRYKSSILKPMIHLRAGKYNRKTFSKSLDEIMKRKSDLNDSIEEILEFFED